MANRGESMIRLIDAGVLITANTLYYPIDRVPEFWDWLLFHAQEGRIKIPLEIYEEIKEGPDDGEVDHLFDWITGEEVKNNIILAEEADISLVSRVVSEGYGADLTDSEIEEIGRDPFLIAYALGKVDQRVVVTTETSKPKKRRQNRKIPDVCKDFGVPCIDTFALIRELDFSTSWRR